MASELSLKTPSTGLVTLSPADTATNQTITIPAVTGTMNTSGAVNAVPAGTVSAPAITTTGDTNTGIFFPAADTIAFTEGGVESMRITAAGDVGIGTTTPNVRLQVVGGSNTEIRAVSSGDLTAGATSLIRFGGSNSAISGYVGYGGFNSTLDIANALNGPTVFYTNNLERGRFDASGNLLVGTTAGYPTGASYISSVANGGTQYGFNIKNISASNTFFVVFTNSSNAQAGAINQTGATTVAYTTASDYRLKENIAPMTGALAKVAALKPVTYTWKVDGSAGQGFIAHELQAVVPDCVTGAKDAVRTVDVLDAEGKAIGTKEEPQYQGVDTSFLVATLVSAIQEQQAIITQLQADVAALKGAA